MQPKKLLTIITESILEQMILDDLEQLGAKGYTIIPARGKGARGIRNADWDQSQNIVVELICNSTVANSIIEHFTKHYYANYAMVIYLSDITVIRPEKF